MAKKVYVRGPKSPSEVQGPYSLDELKGLVAKGLLTPSHEVSLDKSSWLPVTSVKPPLFPDTTVFPIPEDVVRRPPHQSKEVADQTNDLQPREGPSQPSNQDLSRDSDHRKSQPVTGARWNFLVSLAWLILGLSLAQLVPWAALGPEWFESLLNWFPLAVTAGLIGWNLWASLSILGRTGRAIAAMPLTLLQIGLFALLLHQIAYHRGAQHFVWEQVPGYADWALLVLVHAIRAADLVDAIEAYGLNLQTVHNNSHMTAWTLIFYHVIIDLFIIRLLMEGFERWKRYLVEGQFRQFVRWISLSIVIGFVMVWAWSALYWRPWRAWDLVLWPVDNMLRVVDFFDYMEIYSIRLHQVPRLPWEGTLTLICRFLMAFALAGFLTRGFQAFSIRWLNGRGLKREELEEIAKRRANEQRAKIARQRALELRQREELGSRVQWPSGLEVLTTLGPAFALAMFIYLASYSDPCGRLAAVAADADETAAQRAMAGLSVMGSRGEAAVDPLAESLPELATERRLAALETLGHLGPAAVEPLSECLGHADEQTRLAALRALRDVGPAAFPAILSALSSDDEAVRDLAKTALGDLGDDGVQILVDNFTVDTAADVLEILETLDPYWHLRTSENVHFQALLKSRELLPKLREARTKPRLQQAIGDLLQTGPLGTDFVFSELERFVKSGDAASCSNAVDVLMKLEETHSGLVARLIELLSEADQGVKQRVADVLVKNKATVSRMIYILKDPDAAGQQYAIDVLAQVEPPHKTATRVSELLLEGDPIVQQRAADVLVQIGEPAVSTLFYLLEDDDPLLEERAADVLVQMGDRAVDTLIDDYLVRTWEEPVADVLVRIGEPAVGKLIDLLLAPNRIFVVSNTNVEDRRYDELLARVPDVLVRIGEPAVGQLVERLSDADPILHGRATVVLMRIGDRAVGKLNELLSDADRGVQRNAASVLKQIRTADAVRASVITNSIDMKLVLIPAGGFLMGWPHAETEYEIKYRNSYTVHVRRRDHMRPAHRVRITRPFYLGVNMVTQGQYELVMGDDPEKTDSRPAGEYWRSAVEFCRRLSEKEGTTYRLPTEAEWEYACRAGSTTAWCFGDSQSGRDEAVAQNKSNAWGLYGMHETGEWCADWYDPDYYRISRVGDPMGPESGTERVWRGGESADRRGADIRYVPNFFRVVLVAAEP